MARTHPLKAPEYFIRAVTVHRQASVPHLIRLDHPGVLCLADGVCAFGVALPPFLAPRRIEIRIITSQRELLRIPLN